ncbi:MAG: hypothetical protein GQ561_08935 [Calditrichae bacterium]|nr:hypothetical protein [Calditrichia bacterium]
MNYIKVLAILTMVSVTIMNCSEDTPLESSPTLSTFGEIQKQVFDAGCNNSGCHAGNNPAANLNLTPGNSHNQLVEVTSVLVPAQKRVDTNNSAESVLVRILRVDVSPRMPFGGTPLSSATIDSIAKWIDEGAQNN